jgi:hypothetical protein
MKTSHRHDLKTNELAEWIANLPQWARENRTTIIYVSVVAVLVAGSALWYWRKKNVGSVREQLAFTNLVARLSQSKRQVLMAQSRGVDASYMFIETALALQTTADGAEDEQMAALALIKRAEALRAGVHYRQETVNQTELLTAINGAKTAYITAVEKAATNPSLRAMARFGLGLCEEELGNFDGAQQIYRDLVSNSDFEGTTTVAKAKQRLETMADYKQRVAFRASPKPKPAPDDFLQPPIPLRPIDVNLMAPEPNRFIVVPDVNVGPGPNIVFKALDVNQPTQTPNRGPVVPDINMPRE